MSYSANAFKEVKIKEKWGKCNLKRKCIMLSFVSDNANKYKVVIWKEIKAKTIEKEGNIILLSLVSWVIIQKNIKR